MTNWGYTVMTEQSGPRELVRYAVAAEANGFDFEVSSDHFSPWLTSQGHAPYAWAVLGAVAHATERVELMTYVTCPTIRYHPVVVAQKAATLSLLSEGRFTLGLGSGENLNEHVVGEGWPSVARFAPLADHVIQVQPDAEVVSTWKAQHSGTSRIIGQLPICWDPDKDTAIACGPDLDEIAERARPFLDAGFTDIAFVQVGDEGQDRFLAEAAGPLLERVRAMS